MDVFLRDLAVFKQFLEKTKENFERPCRQAQSVIKPGTSRQPVLRAQPLGH